MNPVPRGSTQKNVNQVVYNSIAPKIVNSASELQLVDTPCGDGEFAHYLGGRFPHLKVTGVDLFTQPVGKSFEFFKQSAHQHFRQRAPESVDIIICISGVMCFDGVPELVAAFHSALKKNGVLVITNDNIMSVRDRLNFLFFGHFKRFKLLYANNEGNWNVVLPQSLVAQIRKNGFTNWQMAYTSIYTEDLLFIPIALLIYPVFVCYLLLRKSELTASERLKLFPFKMLLSRHYVITAYK